MKKEAEQFENGSMKLAIVETITGNVRCFKELRKVCILALNAIPQSEITKYYIYGLEDKQFVPATTDGIYVYDPENEAAKNYVNRRISEDKIWKPGELYLKS